MFAEEPIPRNCGIEAGAVPFSVVVWGHEGDVDAGVQGRTRDEMLANARLIAAAPDLLEALRDIVRGYDGPTVDAATAVSSHIQAARMAIAKAEGQC